ncbi:hypothetical protein K2X33_03055, partial [bacterium]|nr:hypothetical protein [bacterium]
AAFSKDQTIVTYFAVKLTSKPRMLFMPQRWIDAAFPTLQAFAAAKPFGSRVGPDPSADPLLPAGSGVGQNSRFLNFRFTPSDQRGLARSTKMLALFDALHPYNGGGLPEGEQNAGWPDAGKGGELKTALRAITAPTVFDAMMYTIFPNPNRQDDWSEPNYAMALYPDYLEASDGNNQIVNTPEPRTPAYFQTSGRQRGPGYIPVSSPESGSNYGGLRYAEEGPASHAVEIASDLPVIGGREVEFGFANRDLVNSGWAPEGRRGRIGYSVKFISFDALMRTMVVRDSNGQQGPIQNPPTGDVNLNNIYH